MIFLFKGVLNQLNGKALAADEEILYILLGLTIFYESF